MVRVDILTLFPEMFNGPFSESIIKRAQEKGLVEINLHNLRDWAEGPYKTVDDKPFGGGVGMVLMIQPIHRALRDLKTQNSKLKTKVILLTPQGKVFNQSMAKRLSQLEHLIFICGHYEGIDERVRQHLVDEEISIGDYVLTGGELPAMVIVDSVVRLLPGVLEKPEATQFESFSLLPSPSSHLPSGLLEGPQYTRPVDFKGWKVPEILLSGDHKKISEWRTKQALARTEKSRPDLLKH
jgi:tRNA (guanine37-N1)-methyltransferase